MGKVYNFYEALFEMASLSYSYEIRALISCFWFHLLVNLAIVLMLWISHLRFFAAIRYILNFWGGQVNKLIEWLSAYHTSMKVGGQPQSQSSVPTMFETGSHVVCHLVKSFVRFSHLECEDKAYNNTYLCLPYAEEANKFPVYPINLNGIRFCWLLINISEI